MGCCAPKSKALRDLEDELEHLISEKKKLESQLNESKNIEPETSMIEFSSETSKIIEKEQYTSSKVFEFLQFFSGVEPEISRSISIRKNEFSAVPENEKIQKYTEIRYQESEIMKKMCKNIENSNKKFVQIVDAKFQDLDEKIDEISRNLSENSEFFEEFEKARKEFGEVSKLSLNDFNFSIEKLNSLLSIEKKLIEIEKNLPSFNPSENFKTSLNQIQSKIEEVFRSYSNLNKLIETNLGNSKSSEESSVIIPNQFELNWHTYEKLSDSILSSFTKFIDLSNNLGHLLSDNKLNLELQDLDKAITFHFSNSNSSKETSVSRLNRLSRSKNDLNLFTISILNHINTSHQSLPKTVQFLKEKTLKFLKNSEEQDKIMLEMTEKFSNLENSIDEIELKIDEILAEYIKDLYKSAPINDSKSKNMLDKLKSEIVAKNEDSSKNLYDHINCLLSKLEMFGNIDKVRIGIRETQTKELNKIKSDHQEKINELLNNVSQKENEKASLENTLKTLKANSEKSAEIIEKTMKNAKEKDSEIVELKNHLASLQEELEQCKQDLEKATDEISDLNKENRETKKHLRAKENELNELKETMEKNS